MSTGRPYIRGGIELDRIRLEGLSATGFHGVLDHEREQGQTFVADVVVHVNTRDAGVSDALERSVDYSVVAQRVIDVLAGEPSQLIETVAYRIAQSVLEMAKVECVDVTVHKPQAPLTVDFADVSVSIRRDQRDGSLWADRRIGSSAGFSDDPLTGYGGPPPRDLMDERPGHPVPALIALGANLGDALATLSAAVGDLHRIIGVEVKTVSPLVRSAPEGGADQPEYLNAVVRMETTLSPRELLQACLGIELVHGRERTVKGAARTLDLDLIQYGDVIGETDDVTLPHPRAHLRGFVLHPWVAMEPEAVLALHGTVAELLGGPTIEAVEFVHGAAPQETDGAESRSDGSDTENLDSETPN